MAALIRRRPRKQQQQQQLQHDESDIDQIEDNNSIIVTSLNEASTTLSVRSVASKIKSVPNEFNKELTTRRLSNVARTKISRIPTNSPVIMGSRVADTIPPQQLIPDPSPIPVSDNRIEQLVETLSPNLLRITSGQPQQDPKLQQERQQLETKTLLNVEDMSSTTNSTSNDSVTDLDDPNVRFNDDDDYVVPFRRRHKANASGPYVGGFHRFHPITNDIDRSTLLPGNTLVPRQFRHRERLIVNGTGIYYDIVDDDDYYTYDNKTYAASVSIRVTPQNNYYVSWGILWSGFLITCLYAIYQICYLDPNYNRYKNRYHYSKGTITKDKNSNSKSTSYRSVHKQRRQQRTHAITYESQHAATVLNMTDDGVDEHDSPSSTVTTTSPSTPVTLKSNLKHPIMVAKNSTSNSSKQPQSQQSRLVQQHHQHSASNDSMAGILLSNSMGTEIGGANANSRVDGNNDFYLYNQISNESTTKSSADETRTTFRKLLLAAMISRMIFMPIQIWSDPQWYQFVSDTLPEMIFASAWTLVVTFFIQLVSIATGTGTNTSPGIVIQATTYVVYLFLIGTQLFNAVATVLLYALLCCIYATLLGVVLFYCPRLIVLLRPTLLPHPDEQQQQEQQQSGEGRPASGSQIDSAFTQQKPSMTNLHSSHSSHSSSDSDSASSKIRNRTGPALAARLVLVTILCIGVFLAHTISYARLVVMPPRRVYWWWSYGCMELLPSIMFLILMHPRTEKKEPDDILDADLATPLMAPPPPLSTSSSTASISGSERYRLFGLFRRSDSDTIRPNDSQNSNIQPNSVTTTNGGGASATGGVAGGGGGGGSTKTVSTPPSTGLMTGSMSNSNTPSSSDSNQKHHLNEATALLKNTSDGISGNPKSATIGSSGYGSVTGTLSTGVSPGMVG